MSDIDEGLKAIHKVLKDIRQCNREIRDLMKGAAEAIVAKVEGDDDDEDDDDDDDDDQGGDDEPESTGKRRTG